MRRIITILIIVLLSFGLGWWINDTLPIASGVIADAQRSDSLKNSDTLSVDGSKIVVSKSLKRKTIRDYVSDDQFIR